jgi:pimeloyl-ACP methyl ester carboxylesterase
MRLPRDIRSQDRIWTPGRILALLAIAVVVAGLAHTRFSHPAGWAAMPPGAEAGQLTTTSCTYPTEKGNVRADCGTLVVPENRADPKSRLIALPVTRIRSRSPHPAEPIFRLEGGPGRSNMDFPFASRYTDHHDLVLLGYRGVDGSTRLDCPEVTSARRHAADVLSAAALRASANAVRSCANRLRTDGYDLAGYTLPQRVDDFEAARRALGYRRVDLLSESFGTRVALVYAWRHPGSIDRSVMIGANPPGHFLYQPAQTDEQLRRFAALCGSRPECRTTSGDLVASMRHTAAHLPGRWGPFPIHRGNMELGSFFGLTDASSSAAPISAPMTLDAWRAAADGDASGMWFASLATALLFPRTQVWGDTASMARVDAAAAARHFGPGRHATSIIGDPGTDFLWAGGALAHAWPAGADAAAYSTIRDSAVPTLVISGTLDGATPAANATRELLPHLRNGHQVLLPGFGHTTDFWNNQVPAGNHLINGYLDTGRVDAARYVPQKVDFTPSMRQTTLAKELVAIMVGLALATLLSLGWMARRVGRRGRLGRGTRVAARSAWALVLGLGGWFAAALVALIALPSVPVDAELLIVTSMAVPIALAGYWAWRDPDRAAPNMLGLAVATEGALLGAVAGFTSATAMPAIVTTLVGAIAGTNLALIACDIAAETRRRRRESTAPVVPQIPREMIVRGAGA